MVQLEMPVRHGFLSVLLTIGTIMVTRAKWSNNLHNCLLSEGWFTADTLNE